jgi:hypothetical protein
LLGWEKNISYKGTDPRVEIPILSAITTRKSIFFDENHVWLLTAQAIYNLVTALSVIKCSKVVTKLKKQYNFEANPSQT